MIVGSDNYPPYNYEDADGKLTGIDVDLATEAFRRMGYQAVFRTIDWEAKKELVESGEIPPPIHRQRTKVQTFFLFVFLFSSSV